MSGKRYTDLDLYDAALLIGGVGGNDKVLATDATGQAELVDKSSLGGGGGVTDHGALTGLGDDDHPQYLNEPRGDARYYTQAQVDAQQLAQNTLIAVNTAKVSADGSINTHSDVDTTGAASGSQLVYNGSEWVPESILNGFTVFPIWAEENAALGSGQYEWSWGNGSTGAQIGIPVGLDCELFALSFNAETFGTSVSIDVERDGASVTTQIFTNQNQSNNFTSVPFTLGQRVGFRTNTVVGGTSDARVCAWFRVLSTATFPTPDRSVMSVAAVGFASTVFADVPGLNTTVTISGAGKVDGILNYSALRSGAANSVASFRVVINGDNGQTFFDTLSTFNDNGSAAHFVENLPAGTYTVTAQAAVDQPITITSASLTATGVEN